MPATSSTQPATPQTAPPAAPTEPSLATIRDEAFGYAQARHLLLRAGFGGTDRQIRTLAAWGPRKAVAHLVEYADIPAEPDPEDAFDGGIMRPLSDQERREYARARRRGDEDTLARFRVRRQRSQQADRRQMADMKRWWITRMIQTPRPLEEKMTLFWHGHFATSYRVVEDSYHMYKQNRMFREHAAGHLGDLILGIVRDPAMLRYLNNNQNRKSAPNENLARELLELFTLGEGHYTERDIKEAARVLTGFTYRDNDFYFDREAHDHGTKRVLGARGDIDALGLVNAILGQRACAEFIATKLYRFFVRDIPMDLRETDAVTRRAVLGLAEMLRRANYRIGPWLTELFLSRHFYDAANMGTMIKSPADLLVGAVRSLQVPVRDMGTVADAMKLMGQQLFSPPSVKGWDGGRSWINTSTLFIRQNLLVYMLTGRLPARGGAGFTVHDYDPRRLVPALVDPDRPDPSDARIAAELADLTLGAHDPDLTAAVVDGAGGRLTDKDTLTRALIVLTALPAYQLA